MVIGSESHINALVAAGVPAAQLVRVKGGENMQFDGYTIEVSPGLHSSGPTKQYNPLGHLYGVPQSPPRNVAELPEGDSLIYMITIGDSFRIFSMSTANSIERWITGLQPDVALIAAIMPARSTTSTSACWRVELSKAHPGHPPGQLREAVHSTVPGFARCVRR